MLSAKILALGAFAGFAVAQTCTEDIEISSPTPSFDCEVIDASVTVGSDVAGELLITGVEEILGDFIIRNVSGLLAIRSTSLASIEGSFELENLASLNVISLDALRSINDLTMIKLNDLSDLTFGTEGVTSASTVRISDTHLDSLSGFKLATVDSIGIDNNYRLTTFMSDLVNITTELIINNNGNNMEISMPKLEAAKEIQIANTKAFEVPLLEIVEGSLKLDRNPEMTSFIAPNLTKVTNAVSFINNKKLANVSIPLLKEISGDLTVVNNTELVDVSFPSVETVRGGIKLGGEFESVEMSELKDVKGSVSVSSTTDISDFCDFFDEAKSDGRIQGEEECTSENEDALEGGEGGTESDGSGSGGNDDEGAAGSLGINFAVLGLAFVAGIAQLL